ncbi:MAG: DNA primase DnaG [Candidatus Anstonellales archaeon]
MGKTYIDTVKYVITVEFQVDGVIEKPDVVGAIFGQTEGLLGDELDLREIQKNGRIGRIEVNTRTEAGKTIGVIEIPSGLDMVETSIIGAAFETVERVGPFNAKFRVKSIEDTRGVKRKFVVERAKELLKNLMSTEIPETKELLSSVKSELKIEEITTYGPERLPAGPGVQGSDSIIVVEGRADVLNLLRNGIDNAIAVGGINVPDSVIELTKGKEVTLFLDGDRGGDIILKMIIDKGGEIDFIARAPAGKEVEELTRKEIIKALRGKVPYEATREQQREGDDAKARRERPSQPYQQYHVYQPKSSSPPMPNEELVVLNIDREKLLSLLEGMESTLNAKFYNDNYEVVGECGVRNLIKELETAKGVSYVVFDGIVTQRLVDIAEEKGIKALVAFKKGHITRKSRSVEIVVTE